MPVQRVQKLEPAPDTLREEIFVLSELPEELCGPTEDDDSLPPTIRIPVPEPFKRAAAPAKRPQPSP